MKIAFTNSSNRLVAGAERYIESAASYLRRAGHDTALWHENETPANRQAFSAQVFGQQFCLERLGLDTWLRTLEQWQPDLIFGHGLYDPAPEAETLKLARSVFFAHNYHGTCISGNKCHTIPRIEPCVRTFGPSCLALFYPRRCGGLHPVTLINDYRRTAERLRVIGQYDKVITHTAHLEQEYRKHEIQCEAIFPYSIGDPKPVSRPVGGVDGSWNLLFLGRMLDLKGGGVLLKALPAVARSLPGRINVRFAGDGPSRDDWQQRALAIERKHPTLKIEFRGWLSGESLEAVISDTHLHVVPSLWPEPFGLSGLQLGLRGVPTVAFRVGGIPDWLHDGVNGVLAECFGSLSRNLANSILASLREESVYTKLCSGAFRVASSMTTETHCEAMARALEGMCVNSPAGMAKA